MTYPMTVFQYGCQLDESLSFSGNRQSNTFCEVTVIILCICFVYSSGNIITTTTTTTIICDHNIMTLLCMAGIPIQDIKLFNVAWIDALFDINFFFISTYFGLELCVLLYSGWLYWYHVIGWRFCCYQGPRAILSHCMEDHNEIYFFVGWSPAPH